MDTDYGKVGPQVLRSVQLEWPLSSSGLRKAHDDFYFVYHHYIPCLTKTFTILSDVEIEVDTALHPY